MDSLKLDLTERIFMAIEEQIPLKEFEQWLYSQPELLEAINDDLILGLFTFNYNQKGALYEFKIAFLQYFNEDEFMLWKIKANLSDLIAGKQTKDRILTEFYYELGYDEYPFLQRLGYYRFEIEDAEYDGRSVLDVLMY
jgi:hypothetical protein